MNVNATPDYDSLHAEILREEWWFAASEVHGMISALIALNCADAWADVLFGETAPPAAAFFPDFCRQLDEILAANDFNYALLLPEEGTLGARAEALVQWAEGFLLAARYCKHHFDVVPDGEGQIFLDDVAQIAALDSDIADDEDNRAHLTDLEEHCRLGVIMLYASARINFSKNKKK